MDEFAVVDICVLVFTPEDHRPKKISPQPILDLVSYQGVKQWRHWWVEHFFENSGEDR
jgi:hypothetical protein